MAFSLVKKVEVSKLLSLELTGAFQSVHGRFTDFDEKVDITDSIKMYENNNKIWLFFFTNFILGSFNREATVTSIQMLNLL